MKSRIWRLAGVGLLWVSITAQSFADEPQNRGPEGEQRGSEHRGENQGHGGDQPHPQNNPQQNQPRPQNNEIIRGENYRQFEHNGQNQGGQWQNHPPQQQPNGQGRPPQQPANNLPIQGKPDTVRQTQEPQRGYYQDVPQRNNYNQHWQAGGPGSHPDDHRWAGRPDGHGNGWGPGPQYRPGYMIDRFPDRNFRVPYRGQDYFYSGGYWYRPQGPRYMVVEPPRGIRVSYLPDYAREVWVGGALLFLAAGSYYAYEESTQDYVVVEPPMGAPQPQPQPANNGYDVVAYPANGQSPEQSRQDGQDCSRWAVQQSGFDPRAVTYQPDPSVVQAYRQAEGNCLSSRGYQVTD
ncbi:MULTISPECIES: DUF6515 family protein [unclassified Pseudomonas]|uniref:DUF6515 family protein n=1 Tax=unclassified Pseudomonas TaxID=196821 RepID=UPI002AC8FB43|nr:MULTISPECIES: DUF6515 family protein [unclassified Pseudomonas]MEB0044536.1 glycine zipper family protein [Pseudomonas sp. Dout3]MEB0095734.1 glycine zipper family protein [Pseudomonas sp. DC1.2]WPX58218.1 DUF6515 family protein [Pseudomonas sp. DC1.2]